MSRKGENIYKRKDGRWEARYVKGHRADGKAIYGYCYGRTYREAREKANNAKTSLALGTAQTYAGKRLRFSVLCDEWLLINRHKVKESTYTKYVSMVNNHIKSRLGDYLVQGLSTVTVENFTHELIYEKGLSPKTVKDILVILHSILDYAKKETPRATPNVKFIYPKVERKEMRVLSREEQDRLVSYLLDELDECKFGVLLALLTGMRIGEICALRWKNIVLEDGIIKVCSTMQRIRDLDGGTEAKTRVVISDPKTETSARVIPLTDYSIRLCRERKNDNPEAFVLTGDPLNYMEPRRLQYRFKRYTFDCGLDGVHFHTLRHTFATRCVEVGFEIKSLSEILGHANPKITLERYVHSSIELKRDNMKKLAAIGF